MCPPAPMNLIQSMCSASQEKGGEIAAHHILIRLLMVKKSCRI